MPIIKSAKKRVRIAKKAAARNARTKKELRYALKQFEAAVTKGKGLEEALAKAQSAIDTAVKKDVWHKNKAARRKAALVKAAGGKLKAGPSKAKAKKAKPAPKAAKKAPAKKTLSKKPAKKPVRPFDKLRVVSKVEPQAQGKPAKKPAKKAKK